MKYTLILLTLILASCSTYSCNEVGLLKTPLRVISLGASEWEFNNLVVIDTDNGWGYKIVTLSGRGLEYDHNLQCCHMEYEFEFDNKKLIDSVKYKQIFKDRIKGIELCEKINVSRSTLHRLKEGKEIDMATFLKLCNYTEVAPAVFFVTNKNK